MKETTSHRLHVLLLGACNSGKSSLLNMLTGQATALVSEMAGTTTDAVRKPMEIPGVGAATLIDTAGVDDSSLLGEARIKATEREIQNADIVLLLIGENHQVETERYKQIRALGIPCIPVLSKCDIRTPDFSHLPLEGMDSDSAKARPVEVSTLDAEGSRRRVFEAILRSLPADFRPRPLTAGLTSPGDVVLLVMPQDSQAPQGRLILPQVQTLRALLDQGCIPVCCTPENMADSLSRLSSPPDLIITDSQAFAQVYPLTPKGVRLTSFSILLAAQKGDIVYFAESATLIPNLPSDARILIAESCTHAPKNEDIGRVKIPTLLRKTLGDDITFDFVRGTDFPTDLTPYAMIIHCGGCMFNRRYLISRVNLAKAQHVPMTNYGVTLAALTGVLSKITLPKS